ncbi:GNAT family N-acetyltransferase [Parvibium lacunae]|nr:GNAT family N-acetyltransferase [Parvibium lacunae]
MDAHALSPLFNPKHILCIHSQGQVPTPLVYDATRTQLVYIGLDTKVPSPATPFDLAYLDVPAADLAAALQLAHRQGVRLAIVPTYGNTTQLNHWRTLASTLGIRLLGPGSSGLQRPPLGLNLAQMGALATVGTIALVAQSSALATAILDWGSGNDIGFSCVVSLGDSQENAQGIAIDAVLDFLINDPHTHSVVIQLEELQEARHFLSALRALASVKPVIVLYPRAFNMDEDPPKHTDTSTALHGHASMHLGTQLLSHDSALAAALRRAGAIQVHFLTQLYAAARCLDLPHPPKGRRLALVSNGWGPARLAQHRALQSRLALPILRDLRLRSGCKVYGHNPLDLGPEATAADYQDLLIQLAAQPDVDGVVVILSPRPQFDVNAINQVLLAVHTRLYKPLIVTWLGDEMGAQLRAELIAAGIPAFRSPETAIDGYATLARFYRNQQLALQIPGSLDEEEYLLHQNFLAAQAYCQAQLLESPSASTAQPAPPYVLSAADSAALLNLAGIHLPTVHTITPHANSDSALSTTLYISVVSHPILGAVMMTGSLPEPARQSLATHLDRATELVPINSFIAQRMIERTKIADWIASEHNLAPQLMAWEKLLVQVGELVAAVPALHSIDIYPLHLRAEGLALGEVRIALRDPHPSTGPVPVHTAIAPYPRRWVQPLTLKQPQHEAPRDCELRPIHPGDAQALQTFVRQLSPEARYMRFISGLTELTPRMLVRYTQIDYDREMALVAMLPDGHAGGNSGGRLIGVVRYLLNNDRTSCEYAIAIADDFQRCGLGTALMQAIIACAKHKGLQRIEGYILANNHAMLGLLRKLNFVIAPDPEDASMRLVHLAL